MFIFTINSVSILTLLLAYCASSVKSNCNLRYKSDEESRRLLDKLKPLKGFVFKDTYIEQDQDKYEYTLSICDDIQVQGYNGKSVGALQHDLQNDLPKGQHSYKKLGSVNSTIIKGGTDWILLTYADGENYDSHCGGSNRQAHLMILCDPDQLKGQFKVLYESTPMESKECFYMMELSSSVACSSTRGLSVGSILVITFFTISFAYLLIGALYNRCVYGSKGWQQIPNIGFWKSCGSLQADGCNFLCRCQEAAFSSSRPYHGIADDQLDDEIDDEHLLPM